jgi:vacuolar protein sorting-associated protein 33A
MPSLRADILSEHIKRLQRESQIGHEFSIFWVPRRTLVSDKILEEAGVLGDTSIFEFPLYFIPLEKDLLSLELDDSFSDLYLRKDPTPTFLLAKALMLIQQKHGLFPRITGKGDNAKRLADLLGRMRQELVAGEDSNESVKLGLTPSTTIESLIVIDREVDYATPLLTQLTYEGLIDEVFGIKHNQTDVDSAIVGVASQQATQSSSKTASAPTAQSKTRKVPLDSSDKLYEQLRDSNFAIVGPLLNKVARRLQADYDSMHSTKTTAELREFVNNLKGYQAEQHSVKVHSGLCEEILKHTRSTQFRSLLEVQQSLAAGADPSSQHEAIEELISRDAPLTEVLRVLCLESCIAGGIKPRELEYFKRLIVQAYGYHHILTLDALEKLQLLLPRGSPLSIPMTGAISSAGIKTNYTSLRKQLRLIVDEVNEQDPNDIAYVYSGYAPLSVRLVQCIIQKQYLLSFTRGASSNGAGGASIAGAGGQGWRGFDEAAKNARGATFDEVQKGEDKAVKARSLLTGSGEKKTIIVAFLGGITFTEIAALRYIAKREDGMIDSLSSSRGANFSELARKQIIICTTSIISGNRMMDAAIEKEQFKKGNLVETTSS